MITQGILTPRNSCSGCSVNCFCNLVVDDLDIRDHRPCMRSFRGEFSSPPKQKVNGILDTDTRPVHPGREPESMTRWVCQPQGGEAHQESMSSYISILKAK
ncbi:uncharacterized protein LOC144219464 isoform X2 [Crocuta crocuta]